MNCWKSVNLSKDLGNNRFRIISLFISIFTFSLLYVAFTLLHGTKSVHNSLFVPFLIGIYLLPVAHAWMHIIPCILLHKSVKVYHKRILVVFPTIRYYTKTHISKKTSIFMNIAPTLFLTIPGLLASYFLRDYYIFFLLLTSVHIGMTFKDFWFMSHLIHAPKRACIVTEQDGLDILLKANEGPY